MAGVSLKNVKKVYPGGIEAVRDFSLDIYDGEFIVFVGPSGCGKSTTLRMIAGLEEISEGELYIGGRICNHVPSKDRDIAMVFQNYALYPHMTVYKNMSFALQLQKVPRDEIAQKVENAAKILDIENLLNRSPKSLSGGQRQRVALGRAMVRSPAIFLLDEPLSNLDSKLRANMRGEILKLHKRLGATFVYVTHDQTEAMTMGDRIVVMNEGVIQQVDTPSDLYENPGNLFVAGFIGAQQMNFIDAVAYKSADGFFARIGQTLLPLNKGALRKGENIVIGIRSEDIALDPNGDIDARVELCEMMGSEAYLHCSNDYISLVARVPARNIPKEGENVKLAINQNRVHLFDKKTEKAI